jgi:hypothetical protein
VSLLTTQSSVLFHSKTRKKQKTIKNWCYINTTNPKKTCRLVSLSLSLAALAGAVGVRVQ